LASLPVPRVIRAGNRGPFTLDGTRSYLVGRRNTAVIDPGPNVEEHARALSLALEGAWEIRILLTHAHGDHAGGAGRLADVLGAPVLGPPSAGFTPLRGGERVPTDEGDLFSLATPGHTRDHLAFFWPSGRALFAGDLILGRGATTWLGEYPGCVADYLDSLEKVRDLAPEVIYPAHGSPVRNPPETLEAYRRHRIERLHQVEEVRKANAGASVDEILLAIYGGDLPPRVSVAARQSIQVMLHHLKLDQ
jgi:glyoxylase-like metal-dependent hydrolase (beta-lactamase superfamily II)